MKTFFRYIFCLAMIGYIKASDAQMLKVGDQVPDFLIGDVLNYPDSALRLSNFKADLIVLDFWGHGCASCIKAFPKIDSLQKQFGDKVQFVLVNNESKDSTAKWIQKRTNIQVPRVPLVTGGGMLSHFFPQNFYPWHVWLDADRKVKYITVGSNATADNITAFLRGEDLPFTQLTYVNKKSNKSRNQREAYERNVENALYYSYLGQYDLASGPKNNFSAKEIGDRLRFSRETCSIVSLLKDAFFNWEERDVLPGNAIIIHSDNPFRFDVPKQAELMDEWQAKYLYAYDLIIPKAREHELPQFILEDVKQYFHVLAKREKRKINCLVLQQIQDKSKRTAKVGEKSTPFKNFLLRLKGKAKMERDLYLVDEAHVGEEVKIAEDLLTLPLQNISNYNKALKKIGLRLIEEPRWVDCLIIEDQ